MGIAPQELPNIPPNIPPRPILEPETKRKPPAGDASVWHKVEPGFFNKYFRDNPELAAQDFYEVPKRELENYDPVKAPWAKEIIRDAKGQIYGLPKLKKGESWVIFIGPDGKEYATESTEATSKDIEKFHEVAPIE